MEARVPVPGLGRRELLRRGLAVAGAAVAGPRLLTSGASAAPSLQPIAGLTLPAPPIITRAEWGADESLTRPGRSFSDLEKAIVHHTAIDEVDPAAQIRGILRYHTQSQGWVDIGYSFLVDRSGRIYEGRRARDYAAGEVHDGENVSGQVVEGAHASGRNRASLGIAILGNYQSGHTPLTQASVDSVARIIAWKFGPRDLDPYGKTPYRLSNGTYDVFPEICGHRDVAATTTGTSCPGSLVHSRLPEIRDLVAAQTQRGLVGLRILGADGSMWLYGASPAFHRTADISDVRRSVPVTVPVRTAAGTPTGQGAWIADANGGVFSFGDAGFHGSLGDVRLNRPIVGMAPTPSGQGYWLVASDGGVFTFGDARFFGSTGAMRLNRPIVGMAPTPSGQGYWLVASDGGVFTFGDARFFGSTGGIRLNQPVVGLAAAPDGAGYWMVARDGGVFNFGTARFLGSAVGRAGFTGPATALAATPGGTGYWILDATGAVHGFGDAPVFGGGVTAGSRPALALVPVVRP